MRPRCVIVDDSVAVLRAARDLLEGEGISVVGLATRGEDALRLVEELRPDVLLVDIVLGPESGFEVTRRLVQVLDDGGTRTILISTHDEADFSDLIAGSAAIGFLSKSELSGAAIRGLLARPPGEGRY